MKKEHSFLQTYLLLFLFSIGSLAVACGTKTVQEKTQEAPKQVESAAPLATSTFYLVRHAEKAKNQGKDPELTEAGQIRATELARFLHDIPLTAIYSSNYKRTKQTAQPIADSKKLPVVLYDPSKLDSLAQHIEAKHAEEHVLVVGHSNTTPTLANILLERNELEHFDERTYDKLLIVNKSQQDCAIPQLMSLRFGAKSNN